MRLWRHRSEVGVDESAEEIEKLRDIQEIRGGVDVADGMMTEPRSEVRLP